MARLRGVKCMNCGKNEVEQIDDWVSAQCVECNNEEIEHAQERAEFHHYHPKG